MESLQREKQNLRDAALRQRSEIVESAGESRARLRAEQLAPISLPAGCAVSGYLPIGDEVDVMPLLQALRADGHAIALPVVVQRHLPLAFRRWRDGDALEDGPLGTRQPIADAPKIRPDALLVPLLAFDRRGYRLGYGGGYFDRTLSALRRDGPVIAIGASYAGQEVPSVPRGPHDEPLDWVVTERETFHPEGR